MIPLNEDAMIAIKALYSRTLPVDAYQFGDFRLDCGRFELLRNDHVIRLERKPMESLILLLASDGQLATWLRGALILAGIFAGIRSDTGLRDIAGDITFDHVTVTVTDVLISLDLSALLIILRTVQIGEDVY